MSERRPSLIAAVFHAQAASVVALLSGIAASILTSRALGVEGRGEYSLVMVLMGLLSTSFNGGIPSAIVFHVGSGRIAGSRMVKNAAIAALVLGLLGVSVVLVSEKTGVLGFVLGQADLTTALRVAVFSLPLNLFHGFLMHILLAEGRVATFNTVAPAGASVFFVCLWVVHLMHGLTPLLAVSVSVVVQFVSVLSMMYGRTDRRAVIHAALMKREELTSMASFAGVSHIGSVIQLLNIRIGTLLVSHHLGFVGVGTYTLASNLAEMLWVLSRPVATVLFPQVAAQGQGASAHGAVRQATRYTLYLTVVAASVAAAAAPFAVPMLYGEAFSSAVPPFWWLLPGVAVYSIANVLSVYVAGCGRPWLNAIASALSLVLGASIGAALLPRFGLSGIAVGTAIGLLAATAAIALGSAAMMRCTVTAFFAPPSGDEMKRVLLRLSRREAVRV